MHLLYYIATCEEGLVRLAGGTLEREGRVEVCKDGEFGTVCDMKWGRADGQVVCNQLGYSTKGKFCLYIIYYNIVFAHSTVTNNNYQVS